MYHDVNFIIDLSCQSGNEHTKEDIQTQQNLNALMKLLIINILLITNPCKE